jgi:organic radical activating enzyme
MATLPKWYHGITLTGGEPFDQEEPCFLIARKARYLGLSVWTYTGYTFEHLLTTGYHPLICHTDVLVDGPFQSALCTTDDAYIGSTNQRIIRLRGGIVDGDESTTFHDLAPGAGRSLCGETERTGAIRKSASTL